jgi:hypothetical protein
LGNGGELGWCATEDFLEFLGEFPGQDHMRIRGELLEFSKQPLDAVRGFVKDKRSRNGPEGFEAAPALAALVRKEANEVELAGGETAHGQRGDECAGTRDGFDAESGVEGSADDAFTGITDAGGSGVGDKGDALLLLKSFEDLCGAAGLVKPEAAEKRLADLVVGEEPPRMAGVFGDDDIAFAESAEGAQGDVLEVPDGGGDEVKSAGLEGRRWGVAHSELERGGDGGLGGGFDADVVGAEGAEPLADGAMGQLGPVAVAAQVPQVELMEIFVDDLGGKLGGGIVREVTVPALDSLFDTPRAADVVLEKLMIVVGFKDEHPGAADTFHDELGGMPQVGEEPDVTTHGAEEEADGVVGIVGNGEGIDDDVADLEGCAGREDAALQGGLEVGFDGFAG